MIDQVTTFGNTLQQDLLQVHQDLAHAKAVIETKTAELHEGRITHVGSRLAALEQGLNQRMTEIRDRVETLQTTIALQEDPSPRFEAVGKRLDEVSQDSAGAFFIVPR